MAKKLLRDEAEYKRLFDDLKILETRLSERLPAPNARTQLLRTLDDVLLPLANANQSPIEWKLEIGLHGTALGCLVITTNSDSTNTATIEEDISIYDKISRYASRIADLARIMWNGSGNIKYLRAEEYCRFIAAIYLEKRFKPSSDTEITSAHKKLIFNKLRSLSDTLAELVEKDAESHCNLPRLKIWSGVTGKYAREIAKGEFDFREKIRYLRLDYKFNFMSASAALELAEFETNLREISSLLEYALQWYNVAAEAIDKCLDRTSCTRRDFRVELLEMTAKARYAAASIRIDGKYLNPGYQAKYYARLLGDQTRLALYKGCGDAEEFLQAKETVREIGKMLGNDQITDKIDSDTRTICEERIEQAQIIFDYICGRTEIVTQRLMLIMGRNIPYLIKHAMKDNPEFAAFFRSACEEGYSSEKTANAEISSAAETGTKTEASNVAII